MTDHPASVVPVEKAMESGFGLPVVILSGTASERGCQHGATYADRIGFALSQMKESHSLSDMQTARAAARRSWAQLAQAAPAIAAEISGIAEGAMCDPIDLYCHIGFEFFEGTAATGCSGIAIASPDGAILGQNWDAPPAMRDDLALFLHVGADGLELAMVASIGTLGWVGQNRFGLSLLTNDLMLDTATEGFPSQVMRRLMLVERTVPAALARLRQLPAMGGRCYLLGDREGRIAAVELSPSAGVCVMPSAPRIAHTNHARLGPTQAVEDEAQLQAVYPSSRDRLAALEQAGRDACTLTNVMTALRDRSGASNAVSKSLSPEEPTVTAFSIIFDCGGGSFHLCGGPPSSGSYQHFHWPASIETEGAARTTKAGAESREPARHI